MTPWITGLAAACALPLIALAAFAASAARDADAAKAVPPPAATACATPGAACPAAPAAATGSLTRFVHDPTGTGGRITPTLAHLLTQVDAAFGPLPVACWSARGGDPYSDHPKGRACDYTIGRIGTYPAPDDVARGWQLAHWLQTHASTLNIDYLIWQGRIWSRHRAGEGWRPYTGGRHFPSTGPTFGHHDHIHVSVT